MPKACSLKNGSAQRLQRVNETTMLKQISPLLQVQDLVASVAFYGQKLGFRTGSTEGGFSAIRRDDCVVYLAQKTKDADVSNKAARAADDGWCSYDLHIHCLPGTLDALYEEFRGEGCPDAGGLRGRPGYQTLRDSRFLGVRP
jgi:hypothetical protein